MAEVGVARGASRAGGRLGVVEATWKRVHEYERHSHVASVARVCLRVRLNDATVQLLAHTP